MTFATTQLGKSGISVKEFLDKRKRDESKAKAAEDRDTKQLGINKRVRWFNIFIAVFTVVAAGANLYLNLQPKRVSEITERRIYQLEQMVDSLTHSQQSISKSLGYYLSSERDTVHVKLDTFSPKKQK